MPKLGPYSRNATLTKLDGRTKEARLVQSLRAELAAHVGGKPSATQHALIEQAAQLRLRLAVMDRKYAEGGTLTDHDSRVYLAWSNSLSRLMRQLGTKAAPKPAPSLSDIDWSAIATGPFSFDRPLAAFVQERLNWRPKDWKGLEAAGAQTWEAALAALMKDATAELPG
jgi:hypothetical protein